MLVTIVLPRSPSTDASALLPGAVLVGLTVAGLQLVSQLYLPGRFDRASELYGAVGTTIVVARLVLHHRAGRSWSRCP